MAEAPKIEDKEIPEDKENLKEDTDSGEGGEAIELSPEEQKAESFGWMPKEKWVETGKSEDEWVPAKHFLKFGELKKEVISKDKILQKQDKVIKKMKDHHLNVKETAYQAALAHLRKERQAALDEGDIVAAEKLRDRIDITKEQYAKAPALPPEIEQELQTPSTPDEPPAEYHSFAAKNPWYEPNPVKQDEMSKDADAYGFSFVQKARLSGKTVTAGEVYEAVEKFIRRAYPDKFSNPKSPVGDPPSRNGGTKSSAADKLTAEELAVAKNFNLTPEQYLKELKGYKGR